MKKHNLRRSRLRVKRYWCWQGGYFAVWAPACERGRWLFPDAVWYRKPDLVMAHIQGWKNIRRVRSLSSRWLAAPRVMAGLRWALDDC
jgi:hypothetical protein